jgi:cytochrome c oxidase subunit 2
MNPVPNALQLWPVAASANAVEVDHLIFFFTIVVVMLTAPIFIAMTYFALKYRAGRAVDRSYRESRNVALELSWTIFPFLLTLIFFFWAARIFDRQMHPPAGALEIQAVGRQWMWKFQHPGGQAEINDLHVPVGRNIRIRMISQDVIHALYIPALRIQMDVLPDRYTQLWFNADKVGSYHLFCSEYCGTDHSLMQGILTVMTPAGYQKWLAEPKNDISLAVAGRQLFVAYGCASCHQSHDSFRGPSLVGIYDHRVPLAGGGWFVADDSAIHNKILWPDRQRVAGYATPMPSFSGIVSETDINELVDYLKSLNRETAR